MPIQNQACGMAVMIMLLYMFLRQKRIGLYTEWVFLRTLIISMICVGLDILSLVAINYREDIPGSFLDFMCKSYLVSLVWVGCQAFSYVMTDLYNEQEYRHYLRLLMLLAGVESIVVYVLPIDYHVADDGVYTEGLSVLVTYGFTLLYVVATILLMIRKREKIEDKRRLAVIVWMGIWLAAAVIQFLNNQLLLVGFAASLGMVALYCLLENPENNIDHRFGCFHNHALVHYLDQCYGRSESKSILFLSLNNTQRKDMGVKPMDEYLHILINWFRENADVMIFKNVDRELVVVFQNMSEMSHTFSMLQEKFYYNQFYNLDQRSKRGGGSDKDFPETLFILYPDTFMLSGTEELMTIQQTLDVENSKRIDSLVCYVNEAVVEKIRHEKQIAQEIRCALDEERVEVYFQPIYDVKEKRFFSAEALVRIRLADGGMLSPGKFIPVAEENGLIDRLGERVFEKVCAFLERHDIEELGIRYLEVNLSVVQCEQRNLADRYLEIMRKYGTSPWNINLEITESGIASFRNTLLANMNRLIREGVSFSLDDFGNGQSNLNYMIDMPVSVMKLDMNMTRAYFDNMKARLIVQSAIQMAHDLDLFVVAEGVETQEQFDEMVRQKVDYIQGYYFSRPLPEQEYLDFLAKAKATCV